MKVQLIAVLCAGLASSTTFNVTRTDDNNGACASNACSLREAILAANNDHTATAASPHLINVPAGNYVLTLIGVGEEAALVGDLDILNHMTIRGVGAASTIVDGGRLPSDAIGTTGIQEQVFQIPLAANGEGRNLTVRLEGLTIQGGAGDNQAIWSIGSNLTVYQCTVAGLNLARYFTIHGQSTATYPSILTIDQSTVTGGSFNGVYNVSGTLNINRSLILNANQGIVFSGVANLTNSTVTGTNQGITTTQSTGNLARISHMTFYKNGIDLWPIVGTTYLKNTVLASSAPCDTAAQRITSLGNNLLSNVNTRLGNNSTCGTWLPSDREVEVAKIKLENLGFNSGPTQTFRLLPGSTAIDTGVCTDTLGQIVATDQRGIARPQDGNGNGTFYCDIGAYETRTPLTTTDAIALYNTGIQSGALIGVGTGSTVASNQATFLGYLSTARTQYNSGDAVNGCSSMKSAVLSSDGVIAVPDLIRNGNSASALENLNKVLVAVRVGMGC